MTLSRRTLLAVLVGGIAVAALGRPVDAGNSGVTETLLSFIGDRRSAATLGERWIDGDLTRASPADVLERLTETLRAQGWAGGGDPAELRRRFTAAIQADYRSGATVAIEGWQLARTQADLCALAYFADAGLL